MDVDNPLLDSLKALEFRGLLLGMLLGGAGPILVDFDREACQYISHQRLNCKYLLALRIVSSSSSLTVCRAVLAAAGEFAERVANPIKGFDLAFEERTGELS
jgi:hypothetical protein